MQDNNDFKYRKREELKSLKTGWQEQLDRARKERDTAGKKCFQMESELQAAHTKIELLHRDAEPKRREVLKELEEYNALEIRRSERKVSNARKRAAKVQRECRERTAEYHKQVSSAEKSARYAAKSLREGHVQQVMAMRAQMAAEKGMLDSWAQM